MAISIADAPAPTALEIALRRTSLVIPGRSVVGGAIRPNRTTVDFSFDREPDPEWIRSLRERWPITKAHSFPWLVWDPGEPWVPRERWVIMECVMPEEIEEWHQGWVLLDEFRGPHPRSDGHMCFEGAWKHTSDRWPKQFRCLCRHKLNAWKNGPAPSITLLQWKLYRERGICGFPMWVIQGDKGGHLTEYPLHMQEVLKKANLPFEPPGIGAMPYAPFDDRVIKGLTRHHRLLQLNVNLSEFRRTMTVGYEGHKARLAKELRAEWIKFIGDQMDDDVNGMFISAARKGELDNQPRTNVDYDRLDDQATETYIEEGRVVHPTEVAAVAPRTTVLSTV